MNLDRVRDEFELVRRGVIFLNHAGVSPISHRCAERMKDTIELNHAFPFHMWSEFKKRLNTSRHSVANMLNVQPDEIAFAQNTTEGINWIANGIDWHPNDRIVSIRGEYPANIYPWMRLREKGVIFHLMQPEDERISLDQIEKALIPGTRLLTLSLVQFASGFRINLEEVGELCKSKGVLFMVDLIQGMGAFPLNLKKANVDFAAGGSQKWLLGPQGAGFFYCPHEHFNLVKPTCVGADSVAKTLPYLQYDFVFREDTRRFEYGTLPTVNLIGMGTAIDFLLECGLQTISKRVHTLTNILVDGAISKGYHCHSPRGEGEWSGIVMLTHPNLSNEAVVSQLREKEIWAIEREGRIRLAPHFYQTEEEMKKVVDAL